MSPQNKVAVNLVQDFTNAEKEQGRANIGASQISYDNAVTDMTVTKEIVRPYKNTKYSATVGNDNFLLLPSTFADGMVVKSNGSLQTQSIPQGLPSGGTAGQALILDANSDPIWGNAAFKITTYDASFGNVWHRMRQVDSSISSGSSIANVTLSTPIQLSVGKKYLISPMGLIGNVEQTKTVSETSNIAYTLRIWLIDSSKSIIGNRTAVIIGEAEIANHYVAELGQYPLVNGTYHGSFAPTNAIITPTEDLSLDTLHVSNGGNINFGFDSNHPAILAYDVRITGINIMEIQ